VRFELVSKVVPAIALLMTLRSVPDEARVGCGLTVIHGTSKNVVLLAALETSPFRLIAWHVKSDTASRVRLPVSGRFLSAQSGTGSTAWIASVAEERSIRLFRVTPGGELVSSGVIRTAGEPVAFSWSEDGAGARWILVSSIQHSRRQVEAFRYEKRVWMAKGIAPAVDLHTPRADSDQRRSIVCGVWRFSAGNAPRRIPVSGDEELAEVFPGRGVLTELRLDDLTVLTSNDSGRHWNATAAPWSPDTRFDAAPEQIDRAGRAPLLRWVAHGHVRVARYAGSGWSIVLDHPVEDLKGMSGPAMTFNDALIFFSVCYRTAEGEPDSLRIALIKNDAIQIRTVTVTNSP